MFEFMETFGPFLEVVGTIFWVWMLIDCLNRAQARPNRWWLFVLIFFTHWVGALIYFFIYIFPLNKFLQSIPTPPPSMQQKPPIYYTPRRETSSYQEYQQGYQPRSVPTPAPTQNSMAYYTPEDAQQSSSLNSDYEEPHATYPEMPPQQQQ